MSHSGKQSQKLIQGDWEKISIQAALAVSGMGVLVLCGWIFDIEIFKRLKSDLVSMKANTAICLILIGVATACRARISATRRTQRVAGGCAATVAAIGFVTLLEHLTGRDLGIDQLLFHESAEEAGRSFPGRMGPISALNFILLAVATFALDLGKKNPGRLSRFCVGAVSVTTLFVFLGYFYAMDVPAAIAPYFSIALHTVVAYFLICVALLLARPRRGMMATVMTDGLSGTIVRRLLPAALLSPALIGWLCVAGRNAELYGRGVGTAILACSVTVLLSALVWGTGRTVAVVDRHRKQTELHLAASEKQLADFFENAAVAFHSVDQHGIIIRANETELRMLGYSREEYVGRPVTDFHVSKEGIEDILARLKRGEVLKEHPAQLRCKNGTIKDVLIHTSVQWEDDRFVQTRCFTRDVTDSKRVEATRLQMAAIIDSSDDAIISKNLNGIVTSWNASAERLFGYTSAEMVGSPILRIIPPERYGEEAHILARLRKGERIDHFETVRVTKTGRRLMVSITISPVRDGDGKIIGASKILRDVTARKQAEAEMEEQRQLLAVTLSSIADAVITTDNQGVITFINAVAEAICGWPASEALGRNLPDVLQLIDEDATNPPATSAHDQVQLQLHHSASRQATLINSAGTLIAIEESVAPIRALDGNLVGTVIVFRDVTEKKRAADAIRAAKDEAVFANQAKDAFLASLSHELRTPLTPILMLSASLEKAGHLDPQLRKDFSTIRKNIELEARIIDDLLDLTRITQGKLDFRTDVVDPHLLIPDVLQILGDDIAAKRITVTTHLTAETHHIQGDPVRLQQVLWNILKNAVKFNPEGGEIIIRSWNEGSQLRISTTDTGLGITAKELPHIFDAFMQGDEAAKPKFGGLGLGLSISSLLVSMQRGRLWAESRGRGQGATFHLEFPTVSAEMTKPSEQPALSSSAKGLRILLVEDHVATRETLARLIATRGHHVVSVGTIDAALSAAEKESFDLVVSDLGLPDGGGHDLMHALQRSHRLPGIALSGYGMQEDIERSKAAGFSCHLTKPIDMQALDEAIQGVLNRPSGE